MNAKIDIKTPFGKSLEGFPVVCDSSAYLSTEVWPNPGFVEARIEHSYKSLPKIIQLHPGDIITIEILP